MGLFIVWTCFAIATAAVASGKGKSAVVWFFLGFLLGPLGLILILVFKKNPLEAERRAIESGFEKKCPSCAELVKYDAKKCRFCGNVFEPLSYTINAESE